jgi:hypothetical protein
MKQQIKTTARRAALLVMLSFVLLPVSDTAGANAGELNQGPQTKVSASEKQVIEEFEKRAKEYSRLREDLEDKMAKLPTKSTPEQIEAHKKAFEETVRTARVGARHGDIFSPGIMKLIRKTIRNEFKGKEIVELRKMTMEADTKGVPLRVNYPYPDNKELTEMPPTLLLKLPQLPKQLRYRFVNRHMLLVDRENGLIVDYMLNALP